MVSLAQEVLIERERVAHQSLRGGGQTRLVEHLFGTASHAFHRIPGLVEMGFGPFAFACGFDSAGLGPSPLPEYPPDSTDHGEREQHQQAGRQRIAPAPPPGDFVGTHRPSLDRLADLEPLQVVGQSLVRGNGAGACAGISSRSSPGPERGPAGDGAVELARASKPGRAFREDRPPCGEAGQSPTRTEWLPERKCPMLDWVPLSGHRLARVPCNWECR